MTLDADLGDVTEERIEGSGQAPCLLPASLGPERLDHLAARQPLSRAAANMRSGVLDRMPLPFIYCRHI